MKHFMMTLWFKNNPLDYWQWSNTLFNQDYILNIEKNYAPQISFEQFQVSSIH